MTATAITAATIPTFGNSLSQLADISDSFPRYSIGTPAQNDIYNFQIQFPTPTATAPFNFTIRIVDNSFNALGTQPSSFGTSGIFTIEPANFFTFTWTVPSGLAAAEHFVEVYETETDSVIDHPLSFRVYQFTVSRNNAGVNTVPVKCADVLRNPSIAAGN